MSVKCQHRAQCTTVPTHEAIIDVPQSQRSVTCKHEVCKLMNVGICNKRRKKWEQQGCEELSKGEQVTRLRSSRRLAHQSWEKLQSRQRSAETTRAAMLMWLAVEVKLSRTLRMRVTASKGSCCRKVCRRRYMSILSMGVSTVTS